MCPTLSPTNAPADGGAVTPPPADAGDGNAGPASPDHCAGAVHVALGTTVNGSTCGGMFGSSPCQEPGHPDFFLYVDAPAGTALHLTASAGVSILGFPTCESNQTFQCTFAQPAFDPTDTSYRLFAVERVDTTCGAFTFGATAR